MTRSEGVTESWKDQLSLSRKGGADGSAFILQSLQDLNERQKKELEASGP